MRCDVALSCLILFGAACSPAAQTAIRGQIELRADRPDIVFARAVAATQAHYKIGAIDCTNKALITEVRAYYSETNVPVYGKTISNPTAKVGTTLDSYWIAFYVRVSVAPDNQASVEVIPRVRYSPYPGSPVLRDDDPKFPYFATGRAKALRVAIEDFETAGLTAPNPCRQVEAASK